MNRIRDFRGLVALVTGGSSGIGLEISKCLMSRGADVVILSKDPSKLERTVREIGDVRTIQADVSDHEQIKEEIGRIMDRQRIDILVNSAGMVHPGVFTEMDPGNIRRTIEVNLIGTMNVCRVVVPHMTEGAHVANISSIAGIIGLYGYSTYSASKFGVIGFSEALRMELIKKGIGVSVILPPDTLTPQLEFEERMKPPETKHLSGKIKPRTAEWVALRTIDAIEKRRFMTVLTMQGKGAELAKRAAPKLMRWYLDSKIR
jgi:3-dehydrosphinganine reductase